MTHTLAKILMALTALALAAYYSLAFPTIATLALEAIPPALQAASFFPVLAALLVAPIWASLAAFSRYI